MHSPDDGLSRRSNGGEILQRSGILKALQSSRPTSSSQELNCNASKFKRFRILVVGRTNAGKTTLLRKVCNATGKPEIFDGRGNSINADVVKPSVDVSWLPRHQ
ncbi:hypothetical protein M405DRAFT_835488 [Rhizopogon salebrosus TDB-379]|nr:hypothetical protein M405DRAFT_835488 [Rhizopogon salebrosus TDB-379]